MKLKIKLICLMCTASPSGRFSIRCQNCGRRHSMPYSDDFVWCPTCRKWCGDTVGHDPDEDDPTSCSRCGATLKATEPATNEIEDGVEGVISDDGRTVLLTEPLPPGMTVFVVPMPRD